MNNKKEIRIILGQKDLKQKDYDKILELIEPYKETEIEYYNYIKARVLLGKKEYTKAKVILKKVINNNKEHKSAYYHMYKINVFKEEYEEALFNLNKYEELNSDIPMNNSLIKSMLNYMIMLKDGYKSFKNDNFQAEQNNYFGRVKIKNKKLQDLYYDLIKEFNNKNLSNMKRTLNKMTYEINETNYPIEVYTLTKLFHSILETSTKYHNEIMSNNEFLTDNIENISRNIIDNNIPPRKITKYINRITEINPNLAEKLLQIHLRNNFFYLNEITIKTLTNKINERKLYLHLSEQGKKRYQELKNAGQRAYHSRNLDKAYDYYAKAQCETNHPIFNYYVGKILYKTGMYQEAQKRLNEYLEHGGEKAEKALIYLLAIEVKYKNYKKVNQYKEQITILNNDLENDFIIQDAIKEKNIDIDYQKQRASKKIKMTEEDFITQKEELNIESYYDYELDDKLKIIKQLFHNGHEKQANHLLDELKPEQKEEKIKVNQFTKNKKLFINQKNI